MSMQFTVKSISGQDATVEYLFDGSATPVALTVSLRSFATNGPPDALGKIPLIMVDPMADVLGFLAEHGKAYVAGLAQVAAAPDLDALIGQVQTVA